MKLRLSLLTAVIICGALFSSSVNAQTGPCGWDLTSVITQPTCHNICNGSISVAPTTGTGFEYLWSTNGALDMISDLCENEYTVTVTDDKKCEQTYTFSIIEPAEVVASCVTLTNESIPYAWDGSILASAVGGDGNYTYEWQTNPVTTGPLLANSPAGNYTVIVYDGNDCAATTGCTILIDKKEVNCEGFRTQTQGGWGQCNQNGNNLGSYLFANFANSFPNGLLIGCNNSTLHLSSAQAVCEFLPSGTTPAQLPVNTHLVDPGQSYSNVFAGQLVTAMLNAKFDADDVNFNSNIDFTLGELIITSGVFENWKVSDVIAEAIKKIGRCGSPYRISALKNAMTKINENYVDGNVDNGFLACPEDKKDERNSFIATTDMTVKVSPNPVNEISTISVYSEVDQKLLVELYSLSGQKINSLHNAKIKGGEFVNINFDASELNNGIYFIRVVSETQLITHKVIVNK